MDPVGPWSAYSYNRLQGVQAPTTTGDLHHLAAGATTGAPTTTAQILPAGFLSPPPVGYEVFSPLFHAGGAKPPAHYVNQHRQALVQAQVTTKQNTEGEYHQPQGFFEQGGHWQQNSPFGILPHESVVAKSAAYDNFNAQFAAQNLNQIVANKNVHRSRSPVTTTAVKTAVTQNSYFQVPFSSDSSAKFSSANTNLQQTCIVTPPTNPATKDYRVPQVNRASFPSAAPPRPSEKNLAQITQIQTKAQTKIYPDLNSDRSRSEENHSSPISFSVDNTGRLNYATNGNKRNFQQNYRHYQGGNDNDFQRPKTEYATNGPDVAAPRKPSPLHAHSQASPIAHSQSPAYPMYNSPINSLSSPQQSNQVTPPLDASVTRPNQQTGNVVYSSVITRNNEKFPNNQNCWDDRRKFQSHPNYPNVEVPNRHVEVPSRNIVNMDRQQYYDSNNQVTMTDLSSCRGDPMSIVKNLQQNCVQEIKQEDKGTKRRKSGDNKPEVNMDYYPNPIPPPAHSSGTNQQQQNGTYFEFDRWNLPNQHKMFPSQPMHQQHQGLMVSHPHGPPPLPYFPSFHIAHPPTEYPSSVELTPLSSYSEQSPQQSTSHFQQQEEQPKVVVPNIEEELNFLSEVTVKPATQTRPSRIKPTSNEPPTAGFMNSYLKFLQGEKDSSPPPPSRGNRKQQSWSRSQKMQSQEIKSESNGVPLSSPPGQHAKNSPGISTRLSQGDPQDDPRYFPLPKERKKNSFDSDDGFTSEDDFFHKRPPPAVIKVEQPGEKIPRRKGRPPKPGGPSEKKRAKEAAKAEKLRLMKERGEQKIPQKRGPKKREPQAPVEVIPRRESSKRAAKEKSNIKQLASKEDDVDEPGEFFDSDSDPAWTPLAKDDADEDLPVKRGRRSKSGGRKKGVRNLLTSSAEGGSFKDEYLADDHKKQKRKEGHKQSKANDSNTQSGAVAEEGFFRSNRLREKQYQVGEFVVIQSELNQDWPAIWRVDGKSLLQKFEPFEHDGQTVYRNISTYTSWTPDSKKLYIPVPVRHKSQNQMETVVEFLRNEMTFVDTDFVAKILKENELYQDNFEVYIQTLISQALDSNFLTEIFQEQDEYFLSNVQTVDDITKSKCDKLLDLLQWPGSIQTSVCTWPCYNIIRELSLTDTQGKPCAGCSHSGVAVRVLLYGQPYNATTLDGCQPDLQAVNEKDFLICRICANRVQLLNKITHQKYLMYIECAKRVAEKRTSDPQKDTTCILNELLADEGWLNQLFLDVRTAWCEVDSLSHNHKTKNSYSKQ